MFIDGGGSGASDSASGTITNAPGVGREFTVSMATVLQVRDAFLRASRRLETAAQRTGRSVQVDPPGTDDTSADLAEFLNGLFWRDEDSYVERVLQIAKSYEDAAENCTAIALQYGYTEEQITASFQSTLRGDG